MMRDADCPECGCLSLQTGRGPGSRCWRFKCLSCLAEFTGFLPRKLDLDVDQPLHILKGDGKAVRS